MDTPANQRPGNHEREGNSQPNGLENTGPDAPQRRDQSGPERAPPDIRPWLRKVGIYSPGADE